MKQIRKKYKFITVSIITVICATLFIRFLVEPDFTEKQAMISLFGNYDDNNKKSIWEKMNIPENHINTFFSNNVGIVSAIFFQPYKEDGKTKYFLITQTIPTDVPFGCHACMPLLSAAIFSKLDGIWKIETKNLFVMYEGEYSVPPKTELIRVGNDKFAVRLEYEHRFDMLLETEISILIPYQNHIEKAYQQVIYFDNFSGCGWSEQCAAYKTEIDFDQSTNDEFYRIKTTRFGTEIDHAQDHMAVPVEEASVYQFRNGKYVQTSWKGHRKIKYNEVDSYN